MPSIITAQTRAHHFSAEAERLERLGDGSLAEVARQLADHWIAELERLNHLRRDDPDTIYGLLG